MDQFKEDRTFTLILRLHHNVIKTAIRRISLAYSRISLKDVAKKLDLGTSDNPDHIAAEYIIAKVNILVFPFWHEKFPKFLIFLIPRQTIPIYFSWT